MPKWRPWVRVFICFFFLNLITRKSLYRYVTDVLYGHGTNPYNHTIGEGGGRLCTRTVRGGNEPNDVGGRSTYPSACTACTGRDGEPANFSGVVTTCGKMAAAAATVAAQRPQNFVACRHGNDLAAAQPRSPQPLPPAHRSGKSHTYPSAADPRGSPAKSLSTGGTHTRGRRRALARTRTPTHPWPAQSFVSRAQGVRGITVRLLRDFIDQRRSNGKIYFPPRLFCYHVSFLMIYRLLPVH